MNKKIFSKLNKRKNLYIIVFMILIVSFVYALSVGVAPTGGHLISSFNMPAGCFNGGGLFFNGYSWECLIIPSQNLFWSTVGDSVFYESGKVGIGTASPVADLSVNGYIISDSGRLSNANIRCAGGITFDSSRFKCLNPVADLMFSEGHFSSASSEDSGNIPIAPTNLGEGGFGTNYLEEYGICLAFGGSFYGSQTASNSNGLDNVQWIWDNSNQYGYWDIDGGYSPNYFPYDWVECNICSGTYCGSEYVVPIEPCGCVDQDGDGYYPTSCTEVSGLYTADCTLQNTDCNDANARVYPGSPWYYVGSNLEGTTCNSPNIEWIKIENYAGPGYYTPAQAVISELECEARDDYSSLQADCEGLYYNSNVNYPTDRCNFFPSDYANNLDFYGEYNPDPIRQCGWENSGSICYSGLESATQSEYFDYYVRACR